LPATRPPTQAAPRDHVAAVAGEAVGALPLDRDAHTVALFGDDLVVESEREPEGVEAGTEVR